MQEGDPQEVTAPESTTQEPAVDKTGDAAPPESRTEPTSPETSPDQTKPPETPVVPEVPTEKVPEQPAAQSWQINILPGKKLGFASKALLGHYELSGEMFQMDKKSALVDQMKQAGFSDWRASVGRWEVASWILPNRSKRS